MEQQQQQQAAAELEDERPSRCSHYGRGCRVLAPCCDEWVGCRLCHNEQFTDHEIDRHAIRSMQCLSCDTIQPCARQCSQCSAVMGQYFCGVCNLFDDDGVQKKIFHCDDCGICRVGGRENFYHCARCCGCYPHSLNNRHRCVDGSMHRECAICLERTFDSLQTVNVLACGHVLHHSCYREYVRYGNVVCPTCRTSLLSPRQQPPPQTNGEATASAARRDVQEEDSDDEDEDEDDADDDDGDDGSGGDDESALSDADEDDYAVATAAALRAVAQWVAAGDEDDTVALQAVAWEAESENDVEGLSASEEEDEDEAPAPVVGHR